MFTVEIKVNGNLTHHIYGHRLPGGLYDKDSYKYEIYEVGKEITRGTVKHDRQEGLLKLIKTVLKNKPSQ